MLAVAEVPAKRDVPPVLALQFDSMKYCPLRTSFLASIPSGSEPLNHQTWLTAIIVQVSRMIERRSWPCHGQEITSTGTGGNSSCPLKNGPILHIYCVVSTKQSSSFPLFYVCYVCAAASSANVRMRSNGVAGGSQARLASIIPLRRDGRFWNTCRNQALKRPKGVTVLNMKKKNAT